MTFAGDIFLIFIFSVIVKFVIFAIQRLKDLNAFKRVGIPGPEPRFFSGNLYDLNGDQILPHEVIDKWISKYGNIFGYFMGERRHLVINDRDILRRIFLQSGSKFRNRPEFFLDVIPIKYSVLSQKDEDWKRGRKVLQPVFGTNQVKVTTIQKTMKECAQRLIASFHTYGRRQENGSILVPFYPRMQAASLDIISRTVLNLETDVHDENNEILRAVKEYFSEAFNFAVNAAMSFPFLRPIMTFINDYLTAGTMTDLAVAHVRQQILAAKDRRATGEEEATSFMNALLNCLAAGTLSEMEVIANAHLVLLAGYETTANSVTYLMYYLAKYPEYQNRLRLDLQNSDDEFFQMVWMESLRILPTVTLLVSRVASVDVEIDGILIDAGTVVEAPVWTIHHDPNVWPEPFTFDPYRFSAQNRSGMDPMSFLSFGVGGRYCLGSSLATEEAKIIVSTILDHFTVTLASDTPLKLISQTSFLNPSDSVELIFKPIADKL